MVGAVMADDLQSDFEVTVADVRPEALARLESRGLRTLRADLSDPSVVQRVVEGYDVVLGALSSAIGLQTLRAVVETGQKYCDISFMPEDGTSLAEQAQARGAVAVIDCGVAPGVSNMIAGFAAATMAPLTKLRIFVGGLPVVRRWPFDYKAGFAPSDVIEEYTRPARVVENGRVVVKEALSEPEPIEFPGLGTLEAFNTDGLRSLVTLPCPDMSEKTLRYPGHIALMRAFRHTGLFSTEPIDVRGQKVRPLDLTAALLFPKWTFEDDEADLTVMRVTVEGNGRTHTWDLFDRHDPATGWRSMSRVTAFPATIMARMLARGRFARPGVHAPETPAREPGLLDEMLHELAKRGVHYTQS
jgi:saccharopine dehydrogenase-like NADP-dependent oxidoreductase